MAQWYHSGIEGYCKAASQMMGLPDNNSGWGNFGRDLFADGRFDDPVKASKTWTLSRFRNLGRSNRPVLFERSWLNDASSDLEIQAIHTCAHDICDGASDSTLLALYTLKPQTFASEFRTIVLPAIADGFSTERYHSADITRFIHGIDTLLGELNTSLPQTFRNFVVPLVAGIIYGPDHIVAQSSTNSATQRKSHGGGRRAQEQLEVDLNYIRITQIFSKGNAYGGYSELFDGDKVILLGRDGDIQAYLDKCDSELAEEIAGLEAIAFPIASLHKNTSNAHGLIARLGDTWYFRDFSSNGSCIANDQQEREVHDAICALEPGDRIFLGQTEAAEDALESYQLSTALFVSANVDESVL